MLAFSQNLESGLKVDKLAFLALGYPQQMCVTVKFWHKIRHKITKDFLSCVIWLATSFFILAFSNILTSDQNTFTPLKVFAMGGRLQLFFFALFSACQWDTLWRWYIKLQQIVKVSLSLPPSSHLISTVNLF